jgi:Phospholipase_D-nuclease N-terminal
MNIGDLLPILIPLAILELALLALGLYDLTRPDRKVKGGNKWIWAIIIVLINFIGPLIYFFFGREES